MRRALTYLVVAAMLAPPCSAAERKSWNQIRYIGGTVQIKTSRYDWNTTLTLGSDAIVVEIAPATVFGAKKTVRVKFSQVVSLSSSEAAWQHVAAVDGAQLPARHPKLFGMLEEYGFLGIVYKGDDGKRAAMLLDSIFSTIISNTLTKATGRPIENSP
jgi:opacity protein-like surface antigen